MKTLNTESKRELTNEELYTVCGGSFWESEVGCNDGCKYIDYYRSGLTYVDSAFGSDEYYIGSKRISKDLANELVVYGRDLWAEKYMASGDLVGFTKEWKMILSGTYGINWDGKMGQRKLKVF